MNVTRTFRADRRGLVLIHTAEIGGQPPAEYLDRELKRQIMRAIEKELYKE